MYYWRAKAQFASPNGDVGTSDWAIEAYASDEVRDMIAGKLAQDNLTLTRIDIVEVSDFFEDNPMLPSLGAFELMREGPRTWLGTAHVQSVRADEIFSLLLYTFAFLLLLFYFYFLFSIFYFYFFSFIFLLLIFYFHFFTFTFLLSNSFFHVLLLFSDFHFFTFTFLL